MVKKPPFFSTALVVLVATQVSCTPKSLEDCLAEASKAPTEQGVNLGASACHDKFDKVSTSKQIDSTKKDNVVSTTREMCYVYWDGVRWQRGETTGQEYKRYSREYYGVDVVTLSIPTKMAESFNIGSKKTGEKITNRTFDEFLEKYWHQVELMCNFK